MYFLLNIGDVPASHVSELRGVPHQLIPDFFHHRRLDLAMRAAGPRRQQPRRGLDEPHTEDTCFSAFCVGASRTEQKQRILGQKPQGVLNMKVCY